MPFPHSQTRTDVILLSHCAVFIAMTIRNAVLGLALVPSASAHFMWMWNASGTCSVTFNEQAGVASPVTGPAGIDLVADKTQVWVQGTAAGAKKQYIELGIEPLGEEGVMLAAAIPAVPPFAMELRTEFGIYGGGGSGGGGGGRGTLASSARLLAKSLACVTAPACVHLATHWCSSPPQPKAALSRAPS